MRPRPRRSTARSPIRRRRPDRRPSPRPIVADSARPAAVDSSRRRPARPSPETSPVNTIPAITAHRRPGAPLYDARFEHDACGVGFVADAGGRSRDRVLPLALAGLAALGHRGAFGADGESSDGAGVALPLDRSLLRAARRRRSPRDRPGDRRRCSCRAAVRADARRARSSRRRSPRRACRRRAGAPCRSSERARRRGRGASRPAFAQAIVGAPGRRADDPRPSPTTPSSGGWSSPGAGSRPRPRGRRSRSPSCPSRRRRAGRSSTRASSGRPAGRALPGPARRRSRVGYAVFHQRYATNTHPVWRLAQPFRSSPTTARSTPSAAIASRSAAGRRDRGGARDRRASCSRPGRCSRRTAPTRCRSTRRSSCSTATGWDLTPALLAAMPEALGAAPRAASARRDAPAPDGRVPRAMGRPGRDRLRGRPAGRRAGRPQRPAAGGLRGDPRSASSRSRPRPARCRSRRGDRSAAGGSARASCCWSSPAGAPILEDAEAKARVAPRAADPRRAAAVHEDRAEAATSAVEPRRRSTTPLRYLAGLDAERARLDIKTMALEGHEPLWSMGDDTPTPGRGRLDRPVADHLRQAFAQVTNPPSTPNASGSSWTSGSSSAADRRCSAARRAARGRSASSGRSSPTSTALLGARPRGGRVSATLDATWAADDGPGRPGGALDRLAAEAVAAARARRRAPRPHRRRAVGSSACRSRRSWRSAPSTPR